MVNKKIIRGIGFVLVCCILMAIYPTAVIAVGGNNEANITQTTSFVVQNTIPSNAIRIRTATELAAISTGEQSEGRYYILENDIHLTREWVPINRFRGTLDGQGHTIYNLFILERSNGGHAGLFGHISGVTIKNITVRIGSQGITGVRGAGGIAASVGSINLINTHVIGDVATIGRDDISVAGGLIGYIFANNSESKIKNSSFQGSILASNNTGSTMAGGLIGEFRGMGVRNLTISNSFTTGSVTAFTQSTSFAGTAVEAGGFVGSNHGGTFGINPIDISNSYTTSDVASRLLRAGTHARSRETWSGNFLGTGHHLVVDGVFRLSTQKVTRMNSWGQEITVGERACISRILTPQQMRNQASFVGWDFDNIWEFRDGENDGFPVLRSQASGGIQEVPVTVTWDANGGTVTPTTQTKIAGNDIDTLPTPSRQGFTFVGWFDTSEATGGTRITATTTVPNNDVTYWARWNRMNDITVTWNANGGTVTPATQPKAPSTAIGTLPIPNRDGYTFMGWFDTSAGTGGTQIGANTIVPNTNVTYWARWFVEMPPLDTTTNIIFEEFDRTVTAGTWFTITAIFTSENIEPTTSTIRWIDSPSVEFGEMSIYGTKEHAIISVDVRLRQSSRISVSVVNSGRFQSEIIHVSSPPTCQMGSLFRRPSFEYNQVRSSFEYNHDLAVFSAELSEYAYNRNNRYIYNNLDRRGFQQIRQYNYTNPPSRHTVAHTIAHKDITINGLTKTLIVVAVRGTVITSLADWRSNFTIGSNELHAGFESAAEDLRINLLRYVREHDLFDNSRNNMVLITGHSRGGAVANIVAANLNNNEQFVTQANLYVYTFGTPNVSRNPIFYRNIFNIINRNDVTSLVPDSLTMYLEWGRHGRDLADTMTRALGGGTYIPHHHAMEMYWNWIRANPAVSVEDFHARASEGRRRGVFPRFVLVKCPVDVAVYNSQGRLVGGISNNIEIDIEDGEVLAWIRDDTKLIFLPYGDTYTIKFTATDSGTMTYMIKTIDVLSDVFYVIRKFENVALYTGREFISEINDITDIRLLLVENGIEVGEIAEDGTETMFDNVEVIPVTGITIAGADTRSLQRGQTLQLTANITPSNATNQGITWTSSNTAVATVSANGNITTVSAGSAIITARTADGNRTATITIIVNTPPQQGNNNEQPIVFEPIAVTGITISGSATRNMTVGQTSQLTANITPSNATNQNITWTSSNTAVATVSANGQVTTISAGTATITARSTDGNRTANVTITVTAPPQQGNNNAVFSSKISAGNSHTVALRNDGTVWAWGDNGGKLGDGTTTRYNYTPVQVQNLTNITAISVGNSQTVALGSDGTVWTWGGNSHGQLGNGTTRNIVSGIPMQIQNFTNITAISAGTVHVVALRNDGTVWTWGSNRDSQLGDGTTTNRYTPVQVQNLTNITAISAGHTHTVALRNDGTVWTWGSNSSGQLGDGTRTNRHTPVQVQNLTNITAISAGNGRTIALRNDGTVWAWGGNGVGQLGDGTTTNSRVPVQVQNLDNITAISTSSGLSGGHTVALRNDGTVWAWGRNNWGQLGDRTTTDRHTPVQIQNLSNITAISAGNSHTVALRNDGTIWAWGNNNRGRLGDGTTTNRNTPVQVVGENGIRHFNIGVN